MGFVDHDEVPRDRLEFVAKTVRVVKRHDDDGLLGKWSTPGTLCFAVCPRIEYGRLQVELFHQLQRPLLTYRRWADHEQPTFALSPELAENDARFDGLAESDFVGEDDALRKRRLQCR